MAVAAPGRAGPGGAPVIERASPADRAFLAMDSGQVPEQFGVLLLLRDASGLDEDRARELVSARIPAVPRLRQRLTAPPFGCGGPVWIDDPEFDIRRHVRAVACQAPGDEQAVLDQALAITMTKLPRSAPLWSATLVTGLSGSGAEAALVVVLHHTLADGLGGLAVLAALVDDAGTAVPGPRPATFPHRAPTPASLAAEAWRSRLRGLGRIPQWWHLLRESFSSGGGVIAPPAARSSLNQPTGPRRAVTIVRADHAALRAAAHRRGATANDAVLVAVAAALREVLRRRGEEITTLAIAVPVSGRRDDGPALGNMVGPMLVCVPAAGDLAGRLEDVAGQVRARKQGATGPAPIAALGGLFRALAAAGGYRAYMNHQHRVHTLVSHVRGPAEPVSFGGCPVTAAIPVVVGDGSNIPVFFEVLSYAGALTVTIITDPDRFPDADVLADALRAEFRGLTEMASGRQPAW
jgi:diacylglycerol O-acyltransferase / wax synthase